MPIPKGVTRFNKNVLNRFTRHLVGHGPFVEIEHVGRRSGKVFRTVIFAFRDADRVTIALTYGSEVDWLKNVRAAGRCRMHLGPRLLTLGPPTAISTAEGVARMPHGPRELLPVLRSDDFVELPVLVEKTFRGWDQ
ncbi:MAG: nitroreductase/quinone reductase family protein [Intrasporangium sp.]|uniref:nitroreductase/quinone reductase family protein n=1 Tax=Intrasporangium sp. TaxID=1925024 RepID=UPI002648D14A|nr:nitroreductase/quinone reductase family protein [Intrasporangium sp.]MDN5797700.1 nitroreductase/quinone reductase family protein [Intrasporangium sp.]